MGYIGEMMQDLLAEMSSSHLLCGSLPVVMVPVIIFLMTQVVIYITFISAFSLSGSTCRLFFSVILICWQRLQVPTINCNVNFFFNLTSLRLSKAKIKVWLACLAMVRNL